MLIEALLKSKAVPGVITITGDTPVADAVTEMNKHHIGAVLVVNQEKQLLGILSERDILHHFTECSRGLSVEDIMTPRSRLIIGHTDDTIEYAMKVFTNNKVRHLPVLDGDCIIGIISIGDVLKAHLKSLEHDNKMLEDYVTGASFVID
jgi:CBS domain-containing protein